MAFFGDKYGERVRVVQTGDFSTEFCSSNGTRVNGQKIKEPVTLKFYRSELVQHLAETNPGLSVREVEAIVSTFFDEIVRRLAEQPVVALARIWLMKPGDICTTCRFQEECPPAG